MVNRSTSTWLCASCCFCYAIVVGFLRSMGVYFIQFQDEYQAPASQASLAMSLQVATVFLGGPLWVIIYKRLKPKITLIVATAIASLGYLLLSFSVSMSMVLLVQGLLVGFGGGIVNFAGYAIIGETFEKHIALANNLVQSCNNIVVLLSAPLLQLAIVEYTWRGAVLLQSAIILNAIPVAIILGRLYDEKLDHRIAKFNVAIISTSQKDYESNDENSNESFKEIKEDEAPIRSSSFNWSLLKDKWLVCYTVMSTLCTVTHMMKSMFLIRYAQGAGMSDYQAVMYLSIVQAVELVTCIISGVVASAVTVMNSKDVERGVVTGWVLRNVNMSHAVAIMLFLLAFFQILVVTMETNTGFIIYSIALGILHGAIGALPETILATLFGYENISTALGIKSFGAGVAALTVPPLVGVAVDHVGNYRPVQYTSSIAAFIAAVLLLIVQYKVTERNCKRDYSKNKSVS